jgi:hypothetical protein
MQAQTNNKNRITLAFSLPLLHDMRSFYLDFFYISSESRKTVDLLNCNTVES